MRRLVTSRLIWIFTVCKRSLYRGSESHTMNEKSSHVTHADVTLTHATDIGHSRLSALTGDCEQDGKRHRNEFLTTTTTGNEQPNDSVILSVGGTIFFVQESTLKMIPGSRLATLTTSSASYRRGTGIHYFDRDPQLFCHILNSYRWGEIHIPKHVCAAGYRKEMEYWGIPENQISPCCWCTYYEADAATNNIDRLKHVTSQIRSAHVRDEQYVRKLSWRIRFWLFLDDPYYSKWAMVWYMTYMCMVLVSAVVYLLWMVPALRVNPYINDGPHDHSHTMDKIQDLVESDPHLALFVIDTTCMFVFVLEFAIHFAMCPEKSEFCKVWYNTLNLFLVVSMIITFVFELRKDWISSHAIGIFYYALKNVNVLRLVMLARFERQSIELKVLFLAVKESKKELMLLTSLLLVGVCIFGGLIFCAEIHTGRFSSIWVSMWWALVTMTTIGYGDYYPDDMAGRSVGSLCALTGVLTLSLPIAVVASNFMEFYHRKFALEMHVETEKRLRI